MNKPPLDAAIAARDFRDFYWLKTELVQFCRTNGLPTSGGKMAIADRIAHFLTTGDIPPIIIPPAGPSKSKFNWNTAHLTLKTTLTGNYKNTGNVRQFFAAQIGKSFAFNVEFMAWLKANAGKTLEQAVAEWHQISALKKNMNHQTTIAPQFEYNRYTRAFLADNAGLTRREASKYWKLKSALRGSNEYERSDLELG